MVLFSVIVPTYNRPQLLRNALASISSQIGIERTAIQVIVVNDGGDDVSGIISEASRTGIQISCIDHLHNQGLPAARNSALGMVEGLYTLFLDDDDIILANHLWSALMEFEAGADIVYGACIVIEDPDSEVNTEMWQVDFSVELLAVSNLLPIHSILVRSSCIGNQQFNTSLPAAEDWEFWLRVCSLAHIVRKVQIPTAIYNRPRFGTMTSNAELDAKSLCNFVKVATDIWETRPAVSPAITTMRAIILSMYCEVLRCIVTNTRFNRHYYHHVMSRLSIWWQKQIPHNAVSEVIAIVRGVP